MISNRMIARKFRPFDFIIIVAFTGLALFLFLRLRKNTGGEKKNLVVKSSSGGEYVFPLDRNGQYEISGLHGNSVIEVVDGKARFKDSPCPNKTCVQHGFISSPGEWAACLPNDVFILIQGSEKDDSVDAVAD